MQTREIQSVAAINATSWTGVIEPFTYRGGFEIRQDPDTGKFLSRNEDDGHMIMTDNLIHLLHAIDFQEAMCAKYGDLPSWSKQLVAVNPSLIEADVMG
jgi:hypothetical protein